MSNEVTGERLRLWTEQAAIALGFSASVEFSPQQIIGEIERMRKCHARALIDEKARAQECVKQLLVSLDVGEGDLVKEVIQDIVAEVRQARAYTMAVQDLLESYGIPMDDAGAAQTHGTHMFSKLRRLVRSLVVKRMEAEPDA